MPITLGDLIYYIRGNMDKLPGDLNKGEQQVTSFGQRISDNFQQSINMAMGQIMAQGVTQMADAVGRFGDETVAVAAESEEVGAAWEAALKRAGKDTEEFRTQLQDLAGEMQKSTRFEDEDVLKAETTLLRYSNISSDSYTKIIQASADMATATKKDLGAVTNQIAMAISMPSRAQGILRKAGVAITDQEKEMLKTFSATNNTIGMQEFLLGKLNKQFGGAAIESAKTYVGTMDRWKNQLGDIQERLGQAFLPQLQKLVEFGINTVIPLLEKLIAWVEKLPEPVKTGILSLFLLITGVAKLTSPLVSLLAIGKLLFGGGAAAAGAAGAGGAAAGGGLFAAIPGILGSIGGALGAAASAIGAFVVAAAPFLITIALIAAAILAFKAAWDTNFLGIRDSLGTWPGILNNAFVIIGVWYQNTNRQLNRWFAETARNIQVFGYNLARGIGEGFRRAWDAVVRGVRKAVQNLIDLLRGDLKIASPSEVFAEKIGIPSAQGVGAGFQRAMRDVQMQINSGMQGLSLPAGGGIKVNTIEYHGSFSKEERAWFEKRAARVAGRTLEGALG